MFSYFTVGGVSEFIEPFEHCEACRSLIGHAKSRRDDGCIDDWKGLVDGWMCGWMRGWNGCL